MNYIRIVAAAFGIHKKLLLYMTNKNKFYCCYIEEADTDFSTWLQYQTFMYHIKIHDLMPSLKCIFFFKMAYILLSLLFFQQENMWPFSLVIHKLLPNVIKSRFLWWFFFLLYIKINFAWLMALGIQSDYVLPIFGVMQTFPKIEAMKKSET